MKQNYKKQEGFTLIELLVVIAIIGLLSTLSVVALSSARLQARDSSRLSDIKNTQTALELYYVDNNEYPDITMGTDPIGTSSDPYMEQTPSDPNPADCDDDTFDFSAGTGDYSDGYVYSQNEGGASYHIEYCLGNDVSNVGAGGHRATPSGIANP